MLLGIIVLTTSCATIFGGSKYKGTIVPSDPTSEVIIDGDSYGTGTVDFVHKRSKTVDVTLVSNTGESVTKTYDKEVRVGSGILSFLSWGFAGPLLDLGTGAIFRPDTDSRDVKKLSTKKFQFNITSPPASVAQPVKNNE